VLLIKFIDQLYDWSNTSNPNCRVQSTTHYHGLGQIKETLI
jgi:hypothetical protein